MAMKRLDVALKMREIGAIPLFYHPDLEICKQVISACYEGGMKIFEFTNRGDRAHEAFPMPGSMQRLLRIIPRIFCLLSIVPDLTVMPLKKRPSAWPS